MSEDITNQKFGKWSVLKRDDIKSTNNHVLWVCQCECGKVKSVCKWDLKNGKSKQCINCSNKKDKAKRNGYGQISGSYWSRLRGGAKHRNIPFEINIKYAWGLFLQQQGKCAISGGDIVLLIGTATTASLDRIDSSKGYTPGNVQWVHKTINRLKNNYEEREFIDLCINIANFQNELKDTYNSIIPNLKKHILVDGFDIVVDLRKSFGSWIVDARNGRKYLDCFSQFASQALGWNYPSLISRLEQFSEISLVKVAHSDIYTDHYAKFVEKLSETLPELPNLFFISSGTLAVENALKLAFDWKVQKLGIENDEDAINKLDIAHFKNAFHGRSGYCLSLTNTDPIKTKWYPKFKWTRLTLDNYGLKELENKLILNNNIAAVIIEPIFGEGGDIHVPKEFLMTLRELTLKYECLLIFDEVQTGFGTGKPWCYQHFDVVPDLLAFGKKIQVCGVASTNRIYEVKNNAFNTSSRINSTWGADIVDLVRSTMILEIIKEDNLVENARLVGEYFLRELGGLPLENVRGRGLMIAFDLSDSNQRDIFLKKLNEKVFCLKCGEKSIRFRPHLTFSREDVDFVINHVQSLL